MNGFDFTTIAIAFALTLFAGLSTGIGGAIAYFSKSTNTRFLSLSLGFSAGIMIYVSFVEIFFKSKEMLIDNLGLYSGYLTTVAAFFGGMLVIALIDKLVPEVENPHEIHKVEEMSVELEAAKKKNRLVRLGKYSALVIALHNFPEGLATFTAALSDLSLGIPIAIAIAIHNIPEGIAVSVPVFFGSGDRKKAFRLSLYSGLSEPAGAVIGFAILLPFLTPAVMGILFAAVAGIMVFISIDNLLPTAREYGEHHITVYGVVAGMAVMAMSLFLFV
ncbi:MAG TPA: zinc transporter ZupT [Bacteroidales bacterium]|nr:zinc transporter ZupT [Bacteroidales bacterium]